MSSGSFHARNDSSALRIIDFLWGEKVSVQNIVRTLNFHFESTFVAVNHDKDIQRVIDGANYAPNVTIWSVPK